MKKEELFSGLNAIRNEAKQKTDALYALYAKENNPYEIGDVVEDHIGSGRILGWRPYVGMNGIPQMVYRCDNLTKRGEINKKEPIRVIYQDNIIKK